MVLCSKSAHALQEIDESLSEPLQEVRSSTLITPEGFQRVERECACNLQRGSLPVSTTTMCLQLATRLFALIVRIHVPLLSYHVATVFIAGGTRSWKKHIQDVRRARQKMPSSERPESQDMERQDEAISRNARGQSGARASLPLLSWQSVRWNRTCPPWPGWSGCSRSVFAKN